MDGMATRSMDRRTFLGAAGASLAMPWLVVGPASARGAPANAQLGIGIIGMGIRGRNLMNGYLLGDERVRVLAVCDVDTTRREHAEAAVDAKYENADCTAFVDYQELLARDDIDAVVIATPDHWHATQAIHACQAGKDIYCEKPLTHTLLEGRLLVEAVRQHERVFQTGSQQRSEYGHKFVQAVEYVRNGRIGELLTVHVGVAGPPRACDLPAEEPEPGLDWGRWLGPAPERPYHSDLSPRGVHGHYPDWRSYWEYSGGYLADMGAHHFDIAQWAMNADAGGPAELTPAPDGDEDKGVTLHYPSGVRVIHGGPGGATFVGTKGMIQVDRGRLVSVPGDLFETPLAEDELHLPRHENHVDDWIRCIHSRGQPICTAEIGARTAAVCQLTNLVYRHRRPLRWDPEAWAFADETPADWMDYARREAYPLPL